MYHRKPDDMQGSVLYPLNSLEILSPQVFAKHRQKYEGREHVLDTVIPEPLNCKWNDALHFTAVPPQTLYANIAAAGF